MAVRYSEGDWILVPVDRGGWAPGLVARATGDGICLGYFFALTDSDPSPTPEDFEAFEPSKARLVAMFGDLGLVEGSWKVIGPMSNFDPSEWPMPEFHQAPALPGMPHQILLFDEQCREVSRRPATEAEVAGLPAAGLLGADAVGIRLRQVLS